MTIEQTLKDDERLSRKEACALKDFIILYQNKLMIICQNQIINKGKIFFELRTFQRVI